MQTLPFDTGSGPARYRVLTGENDDPARRGGKQLVARSDCTLTCTTLESVERTIEALRASNADLQRRPEPDKLYDWTSTYVEIDPGHPQTVRILFSVAWYDAAYFNQHHAAYVNNMHQHMLHALGIEPPAIEVTHWRQVQLVA